MVAIDLFSGAGGLTEGFLSEGYKFVAHIEKEKWACETLKTRIMYYYLKSKNDIDLYNKYLMNLEEYQKLDNPRSVVYEKYPELEEILNKEVLNKKFGDSAKDPTATDINEIINLIKESMKYNKEKEIDLIIGGPPCQAYSIIGRSRMKESVAKDERNFLFYYYRDIVKEFKPKMFIFENVPGIFTAMGGKIFPEIKEKFREIGYILKTGIKQNDLENIKEVNNYRCISNKKKGNIIWDKRRFKL